MSSWGWCAIDSDPGVFTNIVKLFGVRGADLSKLCSLDNNSLCSIVSNHGDVCGLIFLFKWQASADDNSGDNNYARWVNNGGGGGGPWRGKTYHLVCYSPCRLLTTLATHRPQSRSWSTQGVRWRVTKWERPISGREEALPMEWRRPNLHRCPIYFWARPWRNFKPLLPLCPPEFRGYHWLFLGDMVGPKFVGAKTRLPHQYGG